MPIHEKEMYGTGSNGMPIEDYCIYCYKDGRFTEEVTMKEMIRLCSRYVSGNSREMAIANMKIQFPRLKRWAQKEETQHEYHKSINRVLEYIQGHLEENTDLKTLSSIANISPYHFHRIFKSTIGESLAAYVQRLRLEYVAEQLKTSKKSLGKLAVQTGYSSEQALSRAFKKYFNLPPSVFKSSYFEEKYRDVLTPRICKVTEKNIIHLHRHEGNAWQRLYMYAITRQLLSGSTESVEIPVKDIFLPAITTDQPVPSDTHIISGTLGEGLYAIFTHKGEISLLPELYDTILEYWLPVSKYKIRRTGQSYIKYLNNPSITIQQSQLAEIYIPVIKRKQ